jgi:shikimate kinase / 3-dehydroquinate synthase
LGQVEPALVFAGFMGAGKTSAAKAVAAELGVGAYDSDHEIERELGEPIESWFERNGEAAFRKVEEDVVVRLLERPDLRVLALGGGSLGSDRVQDALRRHIVVYLDVDTESAWRRASSGRPLARDRNLFRQLHDERRPLYEEIADACARSSSGRRPPRVSIRCSSGMGSWQLGSSIPTTAAASC